MLKSGIVRDIALFAVILVFLLIVVPAISSIFRQLILLQLLILFVGTIALTYIVHKARGRRKN